MSSIGTFLSDLSRVASDVIESSHVILTSDSWDVSVDELKLSNEEPSRKTECNEFPVSEIVEHDVKVQWCDLVVKFPCAMCRDVLACPHQLSCCSEFCCFKCITRHRDTHKPHSFCPVCSLSNEPEYIVFDYSYDDVISEEVIQVEDSSNEKKKWRMRCHAFEIAHHKVKFLDPMSNNTNEDVDDYNALIALTVGMFAITAVTIGIMSYMNKRV